MGKGRGIYFPLFNNVSVFSAVLIENRSESHASFEITTQNIRGHDFYKRCQHFQVNIASSLLSSTISLMAIHDVIITLQGSIKVNILLGSIITPYLDNFKVL